MPVTGKNERILLVEHERAADARLMHALTRVGFAATTVHNVEAARASIRQLLPDIVLLELELPGTSGHDLCDELRHSRRIPVVMLTKTRFAADYDAWHDGADDYIVKPVDVAEALVRIRAVLRRTRATADGSEILRAGPLEIDSISRSVRLGDTEIALTKTQLALLSRLARDAGRVVARPVLMTDVWGANWIGSAKTLDVHIGILRRKLGERRASERIIHTVRGVGFRLGSTQELAVVVAHRLRQAPPLAAPATRSRSHPYPRASGALPLPAGLTSSRSAR